MRIYLYLEDEPRHVDVLEDTSGHLDTPMKKTPELSVRKLNYEEFHTFRFRLSFVFSCSRPIRVKHNDRKEKDVNEGRGVKTYILTHKVILLFSVKSFENNMDSDLNWGSYWLIRILGYLKNSITQLRST